MQLYHDKTLITANNNNKTLPFATVISKILIKIREISFREIKSKNPSIIDSEIIWKVTVPAIWKNKSKEAMIKASKIAKIFDDNDNSAFFFY